MSLNINYEETRSIGNKIKSKAEDFRGLLNKAKETNARLSEVWIGEDSAQYTKKIEELATKQERLYDTMVESGDYLIKAGNAYQETMESNRETMIN